MLSIFPPPIFASFNPDFPAHKQEEIESGWFQTVANGSISHFTLLSLYGRAGTGWLYFRMMTKKRRFTYMAIT